MAELRRQVQVSESAPEVEVDHPDILVEAMDIHIVILLVDLARTTVLTL
jgi:hypothetical protein